jgi:site-specific DNA-cytosine methylase
LSKPKILGYWPGKRWKQARAVFDRGGNLEPKITRKENDMLRIRKLTEGECYRFMGFEEEDEAACKAVGQSKANIYHQAGDSIVTTVLMGIFGELLGMDYKAKIEAYADKLHGEVADE